MSEAVEIEMEALKQRLQKMRDNISNPNPLMAKVGILMYKDQMDHFAKQQSDDGAWKPIQYRKRGKAKSAMILQDTGRMKASIRPDNTRNTASVGTNVEYASTHQYGDPSKNIPQRKFLWLSDKIREEITKIVGKFAIGE